MARVRAASNAAWSSATDAAARVTRFTLYGSLPLATSRATSGCASASPKRSPAIPIALEKVRSTMSRAVRPSSGTAVGPPNSWYASSQTTIAPVSATMRSTAPGGRVEPVGLFGVLSTTTLARSRTAVSMIRSGS
jgi:hypothetical protein